MSSAYLTKQVLVLLSLGSVGLALYIAGANLYDAFHGRRELVWNAQWKLGYALVVGEVWWAILLRVPSITITKDTLIYGLGLLFACSGCLGMMVTGQFRRKPTPKPPGGRIQRVRIIRRASGIEPSDDEAKGAA